MAKPKKGEQAIVDGYLEVYDGKKWVKKAKASIEYGHGGSGVDPKKAQALKKMTFDNVPISLLLHAVPGADDGALKYGPWNWLTLEDGTMSLKTYLNALQRHLLLYRAGQDNTSDSNINNLDSMIAGLAVLRDAQLFNKVKDDRIKLSPEQIVILEKLLNKKLP